MKSARKSAMNEGRIGDWRIDMGKLGKEEYSGNESGAFHLARVAANAHQMVDVTSGDLLVFGFFLHEQAEHRGEQTVAARIAGN